MKIKKKLITAATLLTVAASSVASTFSGALVSTAADTNNDDWLHASGSRLYDKDGNQVWLTGANWFGFNCSENCVHGLYAADIDDFLTNVSDRGINIIRFPISSELLISWMNGTPNPVQSVNAGNNPPHFVVNPDLVLEDGKTLKNSMEIFDVIMQKLKKYGVKALIDVHSPHADNSGHNYNLWYGKETSDGTMVTTKLWMESITWLANKYKNDDTILAYDLKNEPHGKGQEGSTAAKWDGSTDENNWQYAATQCANSILKVNPNALILVEGVEQSLRNDSFTWGQPDSKTNPPYIPAWWGGNLRGVKDYPVVPDSGTSQIVYSPHDYGPSVYEQTWFDKDFTTQTLLDDYWYDTWAYINDQDIAPLLIGEWGGKMGSGHEANEKWMKLLRDYMIANHINHTFWCLNPNSGDTDGLLSYDFLSWDEEKYELYETSLWQTAKTGKYIGLDHETPLGTNGISLNDYYKNYDKSEGSNLDSDGSTDPKQPETTPTDGPDEFIIGDVTDDKKINVLDSIALRRLIIKSSETPAALAPHASAGDVSGNGIITTEDLILLNKFLLGEKVTFKKYNK